MGLPAAGLGDRRGGRGAGGAAVPPADRRWRQPTGRAAAGRARSAGAGAVPARARPRPRRSSDSGAALAEVEDLILTEAVAAALVGMAALWLVFPPLLGLPPPPDLIEEPWSRRIPPRAWPVRAQGDRVRSGNGKLSDVDYQYLKDKYTAEALDALRAEQETGVPDDVEALIAHRVLALRSAAATAPPGARCVSVVRAPSRTRCTARPVAGDCPRPRYALAAGPGSRPTAATAKGVAAALPPDPPSTTQVRNRRPTPANTLRNPRNSTSSPKSTALMGLPDAPMPIRFSKSTDPNGTRTNTRASAPIRSRVSPSTAQRSSVGTSAIPMVPLPVAATRRATPRPSR